MMKKSELNNISDINNLKPCEAFGFIPDSMWDNYGDSKTQSCTWIRPETLYHDFPDDFIQIVGHTRNTADGIYNYDKKLWCIDALSDSKEEPSEYLVIENGEFKVCKI